MVASVIIAVRQLNAEHSDGGALDGLALGRARERLLDRVSRDWIRDVFERSLYQESRLELGLTATVDAPHPWGLVSARIRGRSQPVPAGTPINRVFDQLDRAMLVMGPPGSGKTTTMLELLRDLLAQARTDCQTPMPVFLPLSAWSFNQQSLEAWMLGEISERYQVAVGHVRAWIDGEQILPMLDGLDEVGKERRQACVNAINTFRHIHGTVPIVVSCRTRDYRQFKTKLTLYGTLSIQELSKSQVESFISRPDGLFSGVAAALEREPELWDLAVTPLTLNIMILAFRNMARTAPLGGISKEERLGRLFSVYVRTMLARRSNAGQQHGSTIRRLAFLADQLQWFQRTVFDSSFISVLPFRSRPGVNRAEVIAAIAWMPASVLAVALTGSAFYGWRGGVVGSAAGALCVYLAKHGQRGPSSTAHDPFSCESSDHETSAPVASSGIGGHYHPRRWMREWSSDWLWLIARLPDAKPIVQPSRHRKLIAALLILCGAAGGWLLSSAEDPLGVIAYALGMILVSATTFALIRVIQLSVSVVPVRNFSHDYPSAWLRAVIRVTAFTAPVAVMPSAIVAGLIVTWSTTAADGFRFGIAILCCSVLFSINCIGGWPIARETCVRLALRQADLLPVPAERFLEYTVECLFLQRVGDGYLFVHRSLQEFFAGLCKSKQVKTADGAVFEPGEPVAARVAALVPSGDE
jgi:DNA polymerase III delta prime subunit